MDNLLVEAVIDSTLPPGRARSLRPEARAAIRIAAAELLARSGTDPARPRSELRSARPTGRRLSREIDRRLQDLEHEIFVPVGPAPEPEPSRETCLVLSGGGLKGSFQVGVLSFLTRIWDRLDVTAACGTSVGAINALAVAESGRGGPPKLVDLYCDLETNDDMWRDSMGVTLIDGLLKAFDLSVEDIIGGDIDGFTSRVVEAAGKGAAGMAGLGAGVVTADLITLGISFLLTHSAYEDITAMLQTLAFAGEQLRQLDSLRVMDPIRDRILTNFDVSKLGPIKLRMASVALDTGDLCYVTEEGELITVDPVSGEESSPAHLEGSLTSRLVNGAMASSSLPVFFPPVLLSTPISTYRCVDGGLRDVAPLAAAQSLGYERIIHVSAGPYEIDGWTVPDGEETLAEIGPRVLDVLVNEVALNDRPPGHLDDKLVTHLYPLVDVVDPFEVVPGLIRINMDYGYMRAYTALLPQFRDESEFTFGEIFTLWASEIAITDLRKEIFDLEEGLYRWAPQLGRFVAHSATLASIRAKKLEVLDWAQWRYEASHRDTNCLPIALAGQDGARTNAHLWWKGWEKHGPWWPFHGTTPWEPHHTTAVGFEDPATVPEEPGIDFG